MTGGYQRLSARLGYVFSDSGLLGRALTHRSKGGRNYERLEFLGDSVLGLVIADALYRRFPGLSEGELTRVRAGLVRRETLARLARDVDIGDLLQLGEGELKSGGYDRDSILADALEAVFGAVFVDAGFEKARDVIERLYRALLAAVDPAAILKDAKTRLQEYLQKQSLGIPTYTMLEITGEPHQQHFVVECAATGLPQPVRGEGASRRAAEQEAAARAYATLTARAEASRG
ncbi:MAG: ribonuclease III [Gammaproteobacteria bacterium]|nr:ribonuclease III [Gammaproteobacteria bacterium]